MSKLLWMCCVATLLVAPAFGQQDPEREKIAYLIDSIAHLQGAHFIRNGVEYDAAQAADHLRLKLRYAGSRVTTAEDFIVYCATGSSISGEKYRIRLLDGTTVDTAQFLRNALAARTALPRPGG